MPDISIIMVTYNREKFLKRSIESVLAQKNCDFELVIVNNGSEDNSLEVCRKYEDTDSRVSVVNITNGNIGRARNVGLDHISGNFVSFVDDDDYMKEDMFSYLYTILQKHNADISVCGCYYDFSGRIEPFYVFEDVKVLNKYEAVREFLKRKRYNSANPCKLFKRSLFDNIRYIETGRYDDIHTIYKLFAEAETVVSSGTAKYFFDRHENNNSGFALTYNLTPQQLEEYLWAFSERTKYLSMKIPQIAKMAKYSELSYMISMVDKITKYNLENCKDQLSYIKGILVSSLDELLSCEYIEPFEVEWVNKYIIGESNAKY